MRTETDEDGRTYTYDETGRCLSVRVPAYMTDGRRFITASKPPQIHRPGSLPMTDAQRQERASPYLAHCQRLSEAWKTPIQVPTETPGDPLRASETPTTADPARKQRDQRLTDAWRKR